MIGRVIPVNACQLVAPSTAAASYTLGSTAARDAEIMIIMNGKLIQILNTQTVIWASTGSARNSTFGCPSADAITGSGLCGVATKKFHAVAETTTGTIHGISSSTLRMPPPGILVRRRRATARPSSQLPKTPQIVKIRVNLALFQKSGDLSTAT